ncbi:MPT63 family protein [Mycolicibacterium sediminis]|uniref:MPT63-like domain-containing protein n=1 Tax=Mycolicibacterium sediminis TaxID=1286180 RepID=A0A7I7QJL8_9MYCO|nr:MPT63 family protein [Mycolicibacterium sediminis]BBY26106.1 hypothetical protein MSEDJ_02020 [Mycolicibacterium sediminis]
MKYTVTITRLAAAAVAAGAIAVSGAGIASAEDVATQPIGAQAKLVDGNVVQGWTVTGLKQSSDVIPYPVAGTLWEVTATDEALQGGATPIVSNFNVRANDGQTYRALFGVATPQGVNPSTLAQGQSTSGKIYFDVTGAQPDSVVYNAGGQDRLVWTPAPAPQPRQGGTQSYPSNRGAQPVSTPGAAEAVAPGTPAAAAVPPGTAAPAGTATPTEGAPLPASTNRVPGAPLPEGSTGTPLPAGSTGTPLPAGSQGTPLPAGPEGTAQPAALQQPPAPAAPPPPAQGSSGTPVSPAAPVSPVAPTTTLIVPPPPPS